MRHEQQPDQTEPSESKFADRFQPRRFAFLLAHRGQLKRVPFELGSEMRAGALDDGKYQSDDSSRDEQPGP